MLHIKAKETKCSIFRFFFLRYLYKFHPLPQSTLVRSKNKMLTGEPTAGHSSLPRKCNNADLCMQHTRGGESANGAQALTRGARDREKHSTRSSPCSKILQQKASQIDFQSFATKECWFSCKIQRSL